MNAPRALPMVSGPVGFAETNSTLTDRGRIGGTRPHAPVSIARAHADSTASRTWLRIGRTGAGRAVKGRSTAGSGSSRHPRSSFDGRPSYLFETERPAWLT